MRIDNIVSARKGAQVVARMYAGAALVFSESGGEQDPLFPFVTLLLHMDGADGSQVFTDSSDFQQTATGTATISAAQSKFGGSSLKLGGTGEYLDGFSAVDLSYGDYTLEWWFRADQDNSGDNYNVFSGNNHSYPNRWVVDVAVGGGSISPRIVGPSNSPIQSYSTAYSHGTWVHIAFVNDTAANTLSVYVDGVRIGQRAAVNLSKYSTMQIGRNGGAYSDVGDYWIDELRVTAAVRYSGASFTVPTAPFPDQGTPEDTSLDDVALLLAMDTSFDDDSLLNKTITANGSASISTAQSRFGGGSGLFNGSTGYLSTNVSGSDIFGSDFTIEAFFYSNGSSGNSGFYGQTIFGIGQSPQTAINLYLQETAGALTGKIRVLYGTGSSYVDIIADQLPNITTGEWHHIALVRTGLQLAVFLNGEKQVISTSAAVYVPSANATLGRQSNHVSGEFFNGYLDEVRVSRVSRYYAPFTPRTTAFERPAVGTINLTTDLPSTTTAVGGATTLQVAATAYKSSSLTFQWQKKETGSSTWSNISGETSSSLALAGLTIADDDGDAYRVVITSALETVTSTECTLAVSDDEELWSAVATDPYWNNVSLLLNFDGEDGSTNFIDSGPQNLTASITRSGAAVISTAQSRFGGSSGLFSRDNSQSGLVMPSTPLLEPGSGPFTAECWVRYTAANPRPACPFKNPMYGPYTAGGYLEARGGYGGASNVGTIPVGEWSFVAICREGASMRLYLNGSLSADVNVGAGAVFPLELVGAGSMGEGATPEALGGYLDDFRYTKGVCRYSGATSPVPTSAFSAPAVGEILLSLDLASATTAYQGGTTLAITASAYQSTVSGYQWQKRNAGSQAWQNVAGATTNSLSLSGLTDAANTGDSYRCVVTGPLGSVRSTETTLTVDESGINGDNRFRVTAASSTTSLVASVESTTGYWKMISSSGQASPVIGSPYAQWSPYWYFTGTISDLPTGAEKTIEVFSCDASGAPSGELEYVTFAPSSQGIVAADASGCTSLRGFNVSSSASGYTGFGMGGSSMPATLVSVRAVGVSGNGGFYFLPSGGPPMTEGGINVGGQNLSAAALNQLYTDLVAGTNSAQMFVANNPGTSADDPTIATAKGYTIFGS